MLIAGVSRMHACDSDNACRVVQLAVTAAENAITAAENALIIAKSAAGLFALAATQGSICVDTTAHVGNCAKVVGMSHHAYSRHCLDGLVHLVFVRKPQQRWHMLEHLRRGNTRLSAPAYTPLGHLVRAVVCSEQFHYLLQGFTSHVIPVFGYPRLMRIFRK